MKCPSCNGKGERFAFVNMGLRPHYSGNITCHTCKGTGLINDEKWRRMIAGKAAREARQSRGETLAQAARRKGITALEISKFERGEI